MDNDLLKNLKRDNIQMAMPRYDQMFEPISPDVKEALNDVSRRKAMAQQAQIDAAEDIAEMKGKMTDVIENQKVQIEQQRIQIERQEKTIDQLQRLNETQEQQLQRLKEIFYSIEDGTAVDKEMMRELEDLLDKQPGWKDFIKDKSADVGIGAFLAVLPQLLKMMGMVL